MIHQRKAFMIDHSAKRRSSGSWWRIIVGLGLVACVLFVATAAHAKQDSGDADLVELASGLTVRGTLVERTLTVNTGLGRFEVAAEEVRTLVGRGALRGMQEISTRDGDLLVGKVAGESLHFAGGDGKITEVKLSQINRMTCHATAAAKTDATKPVSPPAVVWTLEGDHIAVAMAGSVDFRTSWGVVTCKSEDVHGIVFNAEGQTAHRILLTNGTSLSGLFVGDTLAVKAAHLGGATLKIPVGGLAQVEFASSAGDGAAGPKIELVGGDVIRGALLGNVTLQTELGGLPIAGGEISHMTAVAESPGEFSAALGDGRTIVGSAGDGAVVCRLGRDTNVPLPMNVIARYVKSAPGFLELSGSPDWMRGLSTPRDGDGKFTIVEEHGARCWRMGEAYLYFAIDEKLRPWPGGAVEVEIEYFDAGAGDWALEYDSTDPAVAFGGAYKIGPSDIVHRTNGGRWETARFRLADARFAGGQNLHADFRIQHGGDALLVRAVRVRRGV